MSAIIVGKKQYRQKKSITGIIILTVQNQHFTRDNFIRKYCRNSSRLKNKGKFELLGETR